MVVAVIDEEGGLIYCWKTGRKRISQAQSGAASKYHGIGYNPSANVSLALINQVGRFAAICTNQGNGAQTAL